MNAINTAFQAVDNDDLYLLKEIMQTERIPPDTIDKHGESLLHVSSGYGYIEIVQYLGELNADLSIKDKHGDTPLYWAARHAHLNVVEWLLQHPAVSVNAKDKAGETPLHVASRYGHINVVSFLCERGASPNLQDKDLETPLHAGTWHGYTDVVRVLCAAGASLGIVSIEGETALHVAAVRGYMEIVSILCEHDSPLDTADIDGFTALQLACKRGHTEIVHYLCTKGADVTIRDVKGITALHEACREGNESILQILYTHEADLDVLDNNGISPLHIAAKYDHYDIVRLLCLYGCNMEPRTPHGHTPEQVAVNKGNRKIAELLADLRVGNRRGILVDQLTQRSTPLKRVKLMICGNPAVGKTELVDSLVCNFVRGFLKKRNISSHGHSSGIMDTELSYEYKKTYGISVQNITLSGYQDQFSVWDMSGAKEFYPAHVNFFTSSNTIYLLAYRLPDPLEELVIQLRYYLSLIKSKLSLDHVLLRGGDAINKPWVLLVGTHLDQMDYILDAQGISAACGKLGRRNSFSSVCSSDDSTLGSSLSLSSSQTFAPSISSQEAAPAKEIAQTILYTLREEFQQFFSFSNQTFTINALNPRSSRLVALKDHLSQLRLKSVESHGYHSGMVDTMAGVLKDWRNDYHNFPVLPWHQYLQKTKEFVNPLVSKTELFNISEDLDKMGEIVFINRFSNTSLVVLDPGWLGTRIFAPSLANDNFTIPKLRSVTGRIHLDEFKRVYQECNPLSVARIFEHFEMCLPLLNKVDMYEFPLLVDMQSLYGIWAAEPNYTCYTGLRLQCRTDLDVFPPGLFQRLQIRLRRIFKEDFEDQELTIWSEGLICCRGEVQVKTELTDFDRAIHICVRGAEHTRTECLALIRQFYEVIFRALQDICPGTEILTQVLSARDLQNHKRYPFWYEPSDIFEAQKSHTDLTNRISGDAERLVDLICCGSEDLSSLAHSAPLQHIRQLTRRARWHLCRMLDHQDRFGRDWCLLALLLGLADEIPNVELIETFMSPTDYILKKWETHTSSTLIVLIDTLQKLGRDDVVRHIIESSNLVMNAESSVIINITGVEVTSYIC
ncbi:Death-associated protein kinase 1-like isoform X2 [Oopsacas minuta]|uniref:Death-associated protein kinase 1-like isoform X2 n=1 Tax=Oopsacas minuta TaxID=111878 RepID=A0AAV7K2X2_9METZ|nr:Death-associated protein kinase 1-like isoform X2 [Oopsacas minuta]